MESCRDIVADSIVCISFGGQIICYFIFCDTTDRGILNNRKISYGDMLCIGYYEITHLLSLFPLFKSYISFPLLISVDTEETCDECIHLLYIVGTIEENINFMIVLKVKTTSSL